MITKEQKRKEASEIGEFILEKSKAALFEAVTGAQQTEPDGREWAIAASSFLMGASCTVSAMIEGLEEQNYIKRN